jgi:DNA-binding CsgD family transcriptional regulator/tetratricopeptide (TPR) repeat protein
VPRPLAPLVARDAELTELLRTLDTAERGIAGAAVLGGDAGMGKTRLLLEVTTAAQERGFRTMIGHCVDLGEAPPPYLPFSEAFARLAAEDPDVVDALLAGHPALARLLPGRSGAAVDARVERGELFESVLGSLAALAEISPVAVFIEDLHWADQATRDLLGFLFTRIRTERIALIASFRSDDLHRRHPLRPVLAEWGRLTAVTRVQLDPLDAAEVRRLVRAIHPEPLAEADLASIVSRADGNAFFAEELVAATEQCTNPQQLPWQLADLLLVRLDRLSDDARAVVHVAAVGGRRVSHGMLADVADLPPQRLDAALRDAIDAHVLELTSSGRGYVFRHALVAEAVYDDLLPGERVRLHAAYADALAREPNRSRAELARHALASHDLDTAYLASVQAGDQAMAVAAPQDALAHYEMALDVAPRASTAPADRADLVLAFVDAAEGAGRWQRGADLARETLAELPEGTPDISRAKLLYAMVRATLGGEVDEQALTATSTALRLVPEDPPTPLRARLLAQYARVAAIMGLEVDGERSATEALELAEAVGDQPTANDAQATLAGIERRRGDPDSAVRLLKRVIARANRVGDVATELRSRFSLASLHHEIGDLAGAQTDFDEIVALAARTGRPWESFGLHSRSMSGLLRYTRGDWDGARHVLDTTGQRPPDLAEALLSAMDMAIRAARGDRGVLRDAPRLRRFWEREGRVGLYATNSLLELHEQTGDVDAARIHLSELVDFLAKIWLTPWFMARIELSARSIAVLCTAAGSAPHDSMLALADEGREHLEVGHGTAENGLPATRVLGPEGLAWVARLEAEWARLRWLTGVEAPTADELVALWQRTVEAYDYGNEAQLAKSRARLAGVLRAVGRPAEAAEQADLARAAAQRMGAKPLLEELAAISTQRGRPRNGAGPHGLKSLTDRERDVLALLVDGRTNRQIAAQLFISEKTASVHVSNILAKLGVRSRGEAAAMARD